MIQYLLLLARPSTLLPYSRSTMDYPYYNGPLSWCGLRPYGAGVSLTLTAARFMSRAIAEIAQSCLVEKGGEGDHQYLRMLRREPKVHHHHRCPVRSRPKAGSKPLLPKLCQGLSQSLTFDSPCDEVKARDHEESTMKVHVDCHLHGRRT